MNKITALCSIALITLSTACRKAETPVPVAASTPTDAQFKKAGTGTTSSRTYGGQATAVDAMIWNTQSLVVTSNQTVLARTIALAATGGFDDTTQLQANIPGTLTADSLYASIIGQADSTRSKAFISNLNLVVGSHTITATSLEATAKVKCGPLRTGSTQISGLVVNGNPVVVTGAANQAIYLTNGGMIIINEQSTSNQGGNAVITVTALHIILPNSADVKLASTRAAIKC